MSGTLIHVLPGMRGYLSWYHCPQKENLLTSFKFRFQAFYFGYYIRTLHPDTTELERKLVIKFDSLHTNILYYLNLGFEVVKEL